MPPSLRPLRARPLLGLAAAACLSTAAWSQQGDGTDVPITTHVFKPDKVAPTPDRLSGLRVPPGFRVGVFASGLQNARILAVSGDGTVYVTRREQGDVLMLRDTDGDGRADGAPVRVAARPQLHGIALHQGKVYLVTAKEVFAGTVQPDGLFGPLEMIIGDLPDAGQHPNRTIAFGPDGMLYISVGSTCNACNESNAENATILRASPDGKSRTIFASGLRNTIGFDWHPTSGELWGMDHGIDFLGDEVQPEELNRIERGRQYGWPHVWGRDGENPQSTPVGGLSKAQWKALSTPMTLGYTAHAAPMQMAFYRGGSFPAAYAGDAFVAMRGSWNRQAASGYEIVRIRFDRGQPAAIEPFATGFLTDGGRTHVARPVGLAVARDGALLMADDGNGVVYRITYEGRDAPAAAAPASAPAAAMQAQAARGTGVPIAFQRPETQPRSGAAPLAVRTYSYADGRPMPPRQSEYHDGLSPALSWTPVPGARSYAIVMEDPDARPIQPFVHWVAWNIPPDRTQLPEGLQEQLRLTDPPGLLQGRTSRGSPGYYGPRPPVGDPPHHYHLQVFALDKMLDVPPGADRDQLLAAMSGHVIARGSVVGTYRQTVEPPK